MNSIHLAGGQGLASSSKGDYVILALEAGVEFKSGRTSITVLMKGFGFFVSMWEWKFAGARKSGRGSAARVLEG